MSIVTFLIVSVIAGRAFIGKKIQAKIAQAKRAPVGVIATKVSYFSFYDQIDTFGTAIANQSFSIRIKKDNLISSIDFDKYLFVKKGTEIARLANEQSIIAPFAGRVGIGVAPVGPLQVSSGSGTYANNWISFYNNVGGSTPPGGLGGGLLIGWNKSNGHGETSLIAQKGTGGGSKAPRLDLATYDSDGTYNIGLSLNDSGNIGIGTTDPDEKLHVAGKDKSHKKINLVKALKNLTKRNKRKGL